MRDIYIIFSFIYFALIIMFGVYHVHQQNRIIKLLEQQITNVKK